MTNKDKNAYQKQYRKDKKHCLIIFSPEQHAFLSQKAQLAGVSFGAFVRDGAIANARKEYVLPFDSQTKAVIVQLVKYGTLLNQITFVVNSTRTISPDIIEQVRANFKAMQREIKQIYNAPLEVKELVRLTLVKSPEYAKEIKNILTPYL